MLFFIGLELVLRWTNVGESPQPLVLQDPTNQEYFTLNPQVGERYFNRKEFVTSPQLEYFEKDKGDSTIRIFVQGASSSAGFPYRNASFPKLLEQRLQWAFPGYKIEVVNTSIVATNSYTWLDLSYDILELDPDAVIVYGGHNEYYGALGVASSQSRGSNPALINIYLKLKEYRTVQLLSSLVRNATQIGVDIKEEDASLMSKMVREQEIPLGSELYVNGIKQYAFNMERLLENYRENDIPVFTSNLVSNLKDFKPFLSGDAPSSANVAFLEGRNVLKRGDYREAAKFFNKARDLDLLRFRASGAMDSVIQQLSQEYAAEFIDIKSLFNDAAEFGIVGNDLLHEHVHPKLKGQRILADAFYDELSSFLIKEYNLTKSENSDFEYSIAKPDSLYADLLIAQMMPNWPFLRGDSIEAIDQGSQASQVLAGRVPWYQILLDSYYTQLQEDPEEAIVTAKVYLQDFPHQSQGYELLLDALLTGERFREADSLIKVMPQEFVKPENYVSFSEKLIQSAEYLNAQRKAQDLARRFPQYKLFERKRSFLNAIVLYQSTSIQELTEAKLLDALEGLIFFEKKEEARSLIVQFRNKFGQNQRLTELERRLRLI